MARPKQKPAKRKTGDEIKAHIIATATRIVMDQGIARMTLADVAEAAGISKGGLLHYFPSKHALTMAMVTSGLDSFEEKTTASVAADPTPGAYTRAYVKTSFPAEGADDLAAAMIAGIATNRALLKFYAGESVKWTARLKADGIDYILAEILRLAADGLYFNEAIGLPPLSPPDRIAFLERLAAMSRPSPPKSRP